MSAPDAPRGPKPDLPALRPRGIGQKISLVAAFLCYGAALACLGALGLWVGDLGSHHPVIASLGASVVFFVGCGVVLHVMGLAHLPNLSFNRGDTLPPGA